MERVVRVFKSFEEAHEADLEEYLQLTPQERISIVFLLRERWHRDAADQRLARVSRVIELQES